MSLFLESLQKGAEGSGAVVFVAGADRQRVTWATLHREARDLAGRMQARGLGPGTHVAVLAESSRATVVALQAVWLAGASVSMLQGPGRAVEPTAFLSACLRDLRRTDTDLLLLGGPYVVLEPALRDGIDLLPIEDATRHLPPGRYREPVVGEGAPALRQLTSGSTAAPKVVTISHQSLHANLEAIKTASDHDRVHGLMVSWLPLSHDMGLVGFLILPMTHGCDLFLARPTDFLTRPASWLELISELGGTATAAPSFAYALAGRLLPHGPRLDLSRLRFALSGGEPIDPTVLEGFLAAAEAHGFRREGFTPAYGMAEATLAVTMQAPNDGLQVDVMDAPALEAAAAARPPSAGNRVRRLTVLGRPLDGVALRVVEPSTGALMADRQVGEVELRGASVATHYYNDRSADAEAFRDGWLRTGDLGYLTDGKLVICGRLKDVIIMGGRNLYPEDVERAATHADGVRPGRVAAFRELGPAGGQERLGVVVEAADGDSRTLQLAVRRHIHDAVGVSPHRVHIVAPGTLPKTPSGKLRHQEIQQLFSAPIT